MCSYLTAADLRTSLRCKTDSLTAEFDEWRTLTQAGAEMETHESQVLRLTQQLGTMVDVLKQRVDQIADGERAHATARRVDTIILQAHALWGYFSDMFLMRRGAESTRKYLAVADELAWSIFKPIAEAYGRATGTADVRRPPPLVYLDTSSRPIFRAEGTPFALKVGGVSDPTLAKLLHALPVALVRLPRYQTGHVTDLLILAHEMAHVVEFDFALTDELNAIVDTALDGVEGMTEERRDVWHACRIELFADLFASAVCGRAFVHTLARHMSNNKTAIVDRAPTASSDEQKAYPTPYLRVVASARAVPVVSDWPEEYVAHDDAEAAWRRVYGDDHAAKEYEADVAALTEALLDTPLTVFHDLEGQPMSVRDLVGMTSAVEREIWDESCGMIQQGFDPEGVTPASLLCAAEAAYRIDAEEYVDREVARKTMDRIIAFRDDGARSADSVGDSERDFDEAAGNALLGVLEQNVGS